MLHLKETANFYNFTNQNDKKDIVDINENFQNLCNKLFKTQSTELRCIIYNFSLSIGANY